MAQILVSRELYAETAHEAAQAAFEQARIWDEADHLGLSTDYYPTVDLEAADLYISGENNMLEELVEWITREREATRLSLEIRLNYQDSEEDGPEWKRFERFDLPMEVI